MAQVDIKTLDPAATVVVATGNAHKVVEIEAILSPVMPGVRFVALGFAEGESLGVMAAQKKSKKMMPLGRALKEFFPAHQGKGGGSDALGQGTVPLSAWEDFAILCAPFLRGEGAE